MTTGGLDPTPPDPGAAPLDVAAIRALVAEHRKYDAMGIGKESGDVFDAANALCDEVERLRRLAVDIRERAARKFEEIVGAELGDNPWEATRIKGAASEIRALGIDPEAP